MKLTSKEKTLLFILLFLFFANLSRFIPGFVGDLNCFARWSTAILKSGLGSIYTSCDANYLPFYPYILWVYTKLAGCEEDIWRYIGELRLFTLVFEVIGIWYIYRWIDKKTSFMMLVLICLLNVGFSYNTIIWGQVDGIFSAFTFIALYYAYKQDMLRSSIWMILAINAKLQAVIFLPLWGLLFLNNLFIERKLKTVIFSLIAIIVVQVILLIPFLTTEGQMKALGNVIVNSNGLYPKISMSAFNIWYILLPKDVLENGSDKDIYWLGLSYNKLGLLLFCISSALAMFPVLRDVFYTFRRKENAVLNRSRLWLSASIVTLSFFFFNAEMHERYCHPAIVFLTAYAFYERKYIIYILFSIAYFLNLEFVLSEAHYPHPHYDWYTPRNIAWLFAIVLALMFIRLYTLKGTDKESLAGQPSISSGS